MSKPAFMIDCPGCSSYVMGRGHKTISTGVVVRTMMSLFKGGPIYYKDICEKCGGSGRVAISYNAMGQYGMTLRFTKKHRLEMKEWLAQQKEILYGKVENLG